MRIFLLVLALAAPPGAAKDLQKKVVRPAGVTDARPLDRMERPLSDDDVARFLRLWPAFDKAMAGAAPPAPTSTGIEAAEVAWEADRRLEEILREAGATSDEFLRLYRRVSGAWWSLLQQEEHARAEAALAREMDALQKVAGNDNPALKEMRSHAATHEPGKPEVPPESLEAVAKRRAELAKIFGGS